MNDEPRFVSLQQAYHWSCIDCGASNFALPLVANLDDETAEDVYRRFHDLESWESLPDDWHEFIVVHIPACVACCKCGAAFATQEPDDDD